MSEIPKRTSFTLDGDNLGVKFAETMNVGPGVVCDVYAFEGDNTKDLGIVRVSKGSRTPRQRVLMGDATIESFMDGVGVL